MKKEKIQKLKELHPDIWLKAQKKFPDPTQAEKYFVLKIREKKIKAKTKLFEAQNNQKERKRRTRALILLALAFLEYLIQNQKEHHLNYFKDKLQAKEGRSIIDYFPYILKEIARLKNANQKKNPA